MMENLERWKDMPYGSQWYMALSELALNYWFLHQCAQKAVDEGNDVAYQTENAARYKRYYDYVVRLSHEYLHVIRREGEMERMRAMIGIGGDRDAATQTQRR